MLLLIYIFSINRSRGYENPSLEIIVIELFSTRGCSSKRPVNIALRIKVLFLLLFLYHLSVIVVIVLFLQQLFCHFQNFISVMHTFYIQYITSGIRALSLAEIVGNFFFRVETYYDVFKPQRSVVTRINPWLRDSYMQEIQVVLKCTSIGHPCNPCWYPFEWQRIRQHLCTDRPRFLEALFR